MFNLIKKDFLIQKRNFLVVLIYIPIAIFLFKELGLAVLSALSVVTVYILSQGAFVLDEKSNGEILLNSLPVSRKYLVTAKYISVYIYFIGLIVVYGILTEILSLTGMLNNGQNISIESVLAAFSAMVVITSMSFPAYFKYGFAKTRVMGIIVFVVLFAGIGAISGVFQELSKIEAVQNFLAASNNDTILLVITLAGMLLIHYISYCVSVKLYENKEL